MKKVPKRFCPLVVALEFSSEAYRSPAVQRSIAVEEVVDSRSLYIACSGGRRYLEGGTSGTSSPSLGVQVSCRLFLCFSQNKPHVRNFSARNSGAENGCANFIGAWHFLANFIFMGVGIFFDFHFLWKIAVTRRSGKTPGSPRHLLPDIRGLLTFFGYVLVFKRAL